MLFAGWPADFIELPLHLLHLPAQLLHALLHFAQRVLHPVGRGRPGGSAALLQFTAHPLRELFQIFRGFVQAGGAEVLHRLHDVADALGTFRLRAWVAGGGLALRFLEPAGELLRFLVLAGAAQFLDFALHAVRFRLAVLAFLAFAGLLAQFGLDFFRAAHQFLSFLAASFGFGQARFFDELVGLGAEFVRAGGVESDGEQGAAQRRKESVFHAADSILRCGNKQAPVQGAGRAAGGRQALHDSRLVTGAAKGMIPPQPRPFHPAMKTTRTSIVRLLLTATAAALCVTAIIGGQARATPILSYVQSFGSLGSGSGQFDAPDGVAVDSAGNVYVADASNNRIDSFNPANFAGTFTSFGSPGSGSGQFNGPYGVAVNSAGNVYVADFNNIRIDRFNPSDFAGTFTSFNSPAVGSAEFSLPLGVNVDSAGNVYIADFGYNRIDRFNPANLAGTLTSFGSVGGGSGHFSSPYGVAVDSAGNVYVADASNNRIDRFNPTNFAGTFTSFGSTGSGSGRFSAPSGVAVDSAGNVYVADYFNDRIVRFNPTNFAGTFTSFGSTGSGIGQFSGPRGITLDSAGNVYVADRGNNRIVQLTGAAPEPTSAALLLGSGALLGLRRRR